MTEQNGSVNEVMVTENSTDTADKMMDEQEGSMMDENSVQGNDSMVESVETQTINAEGGSFYFKPNEIRVKAGEKVKIVF